MQGILKVNRPTNRSTAKAKVEPQDWAYIDWVYDKELRTRKKALLHSRGERGGIRASLALVWAASQSLLAVILTGVLCGWIAAFVDVTHRWLSDLRTGICSDLFWLPRVECCMQQKGDACYKWISWSQAIFGIDAWEGSVSIVTYVGLSMLMGGLAAWLVKTYAGYAAGSGIVELKLVLAGAHLKRLLSLWTLVIKVLGLCLAVASGMRVGKEGPFVHITASVGHVVSSMFPSLRHSETKYREHISASAAAGISVAFGAPIGGVLFSLEEVSYYFGHRTMTQAVICCIVAAITLQRMDPTHTGKLTMFQVDYRHSWHWFEIIGFLLLGILGGIVGTTVVFLNSKWYRIRKFTELKNWPIAEVVTLIFFTSICNFYIPYMKVGSLEFLADTFRVCKRGDEENVCNHNELKVLLDCLFTLVVAGSLTIVSFGSKVPGGIFVPTLFMGGCLGRAVGLWMKNIYELFPDAYIFSECHENTSMCVVPGIYAIVGSLAVLAGTTRMTVSICVIAFEMTGGLEYLVPIALAVLIAKWVGGTMGFGSCYDEQIRMGHFPFLDAKREFDHRATVKDIGLHDRHLKTISARGLTIEALSRMLDTTPFHGFPVVVGELTVIGYIGRRHLVLALQESVEMLGSGIPLHQVHVRFDVPGEIVGAQAESADLIASKREVEGNVLEVDFSGYVDHSPVLINLTTTITRVMYLFKSLGMRLALITRNGKLCGVITRKDLVDFLNEVDELGEIPKRKRNPVNEMDETALAMHADTDVLLEQSVDPKVRLIRPSLRNPRLSPSVGATL